MGRRRRWSNVISLLVAAILATSIASPSCAGLAWPVSGVVVREFLPTGRYSGHWGIDITAPAGTPVRAAGDGYVSFSGVVVGNRTVTVDHGGLRTSYSYLSERTVEKGERVRLGDAVGVIGIHDEKDALHFSVRIGDRYIDPRIALRCTTQPSGALWLRAMVPGTPYPGHHASHLRRYIRSSSLRSLGGRRGRSRPIEDRYGHLHPRGPPMAEGREGRIRSPPPASHDRVGGRRYRVLHGR